MNKTNPKQFEGLTIETALIGMKAINKILTDRLLLGGFWAQEDEKDKLKFDQVIILAPFRLEVFNSFEKFIRLYRNDKGILRALREIQRYAKANISLYFQGEDKKAIIRTIYYEIQSGKVHRLSQKDCDKILGKEVILVNAQERIDFIDKNPNRQVIPFMFILNSYCAAVNDHINRYLKIQERDDDDKYYSLPSKSYPEKWYALYHLIAILIGKKDVPRFESGSKGEIIEYAKTRYNAGETFYRELNRIELPRLTVYIKCLPPKDKAKWKEIITDISGNDAEIMLWLNKQPN